MLYFYVFIKQILSSGKGLFKVSPICIFGYLNAFHKMIQSYVDVKRLQVYKQRVMIDGRKMSCGM